MPSAYSIGRAEVPRQKPSWAPANPVWFRKQRVTGGMLAGRPKPGRSLDSLIRRLRFSTITPFFDHNRRFLLTVPMCVIAGALRSGNVTVYPLSTMPLFSLRRVVTLWAILCTPAATGQTDSFRIQDGRVGKLHVGMTVEEFYSAFSGQVLRLTNLDLEGMFSPALEARSNGRVLLIGEIDKTPNGWIIFRLTLKDR